MKRIQTVEEEGANRGRVSAPNIQEGSRVWLDARHIRTRRPTQKLDWKWPGPILVICQVSPDAYQPELPASMLIHRVQPVPFLDPVIDYPLRGQQITPLPPVDVDGEEAYKVSSIDDSRMDRNQLQYLICWTGYDSLTWEPAKFVDRLQAVLEFH